MGLDLLYEYLFGPQKKQPPPQRVSKNWPALPTVAEQLAAGQQGPQFFPGELLMQSGLGQTKYTAPNNRLRLIPGVSWQPGRTLGGRLRIAPTEIPADIRWLIQQIKGQ